MIRLPITAVFCALCASIITACGVAPKPVAGSAQATAISRKEEFSARTQHVKCLKQKGLKSIHVFTTRRHPSFYVGAKGEGPTVIFLETPGAAQNEQLTGQAQGAEVIGSALLYPNRAPDPLMTVVEHCVAEDVSG
jgi:hypothetical protein